VTGVLFAVMLAAAKTPAKSGNSSVLIIVVVIALGGYMLFIRPKQRQQKAARSQQGSNIGVGDDVLTIGGIKGRVVAIDDQHVTIETGDHPGEYTGPDVQLHRVTLIRSAIARRIDPVIPEVDDDDDDHDNDDGHDHEHDDADDSYNHDGYGPDDDQVAEGGGAG